MCEPMIEDAILIISDFHLGPGKNSQEFEHFEDDAIFCEFLGHHAQSTEFNQVELIIAGDFFDSVQVKVANTLPDRVYGHHALEKICKIVSGHPEVFQALSKFANARGRSLTFLVGNHDPAILFPEVQTYLRGVLGGQVSFESKEVSRTPLLVKHGNEWDAANRFEDDAILSIDGNGPFVRFPWGSYLVIDFINRIRNRVPDIDKIKPLGAFVRWASVHRTRDAVLAILYFFRFVLKYRFHQNVDQRIPLKKLRRILKGTCYSCDLVQQASEFLTKQKPTVLVIGHTHRAMLHRISEKHTYVNVGTWNPILVFRNGVFSSSQYRTYALFQSDAIDSEQGSIELLQWIPGKGAASFEPTFFNIHMHPKMDGLVKRAFYIACVAWFILMNINHAHGLWMEGHWELLFSPASFLNFLVPITAALFFKITETRQ